MTNRVREMHLAAPRGEFDFPTLAGRCQTQNEFNRLIIDLENTLAPIEIAAIADLHLVPQTHERTKAWMMRLRAWQPDAFTAPQGYVHYPISPRAILYQDPEGKRRDKSLIVAFCGNARRLMVPTFAFLQALDSTLWDVLVVSKQVASSYLQGDEGIADDFPGLVRHLEAQVHPREYRRTITLGTSSGGFYAIWAGALFAAVRAISFGGFLTRPLAQLSWDQSAAPDFDILLVYGREFPPDHNRALAIRNLVGGLLQPIADVAEHNVLGALMKQGRLSETLDKLLAGSLHKGV
jgi:hypothetical protein